MPQVINLYILTKWDLNLSCRLAGECSNSESHPEGLLPRTTSSVAVLNWVSQTQTPRQSFL